MLRIDEKCCFTLRVTELAVLSDLPIPNQCDNLIRVLHIPIKALAEFCRKKHVDAPGKQPT